MKNQQQNQLQLTPETALKMLSDITWNISMTGPNHMATRNAVELLGQVIRENETLKQNEKVLIRQIDSLKIQLKNLDNLPATELNAKVACGER